MIRRLTKSLMVCGLMFLDVGGAVEAKSPGLAMDVSGHGPAVIFESGLGQVQANWKVVVGPLPPLPPVLLVVLVAADHHDTPQREALWQDVQRRTAALSPKGRLEIVQAGHFIQIDRPDVVIAAVLQVAREAGADISACRHR